VSPELKLERAMQFLISALCVAIAPGCEPALADTWQPSPGHTQIPIWPGTPPDAKPMSGPEIAGGVKKVIAGKPYTYVTRVFDPTMTVYSPSGKNTGAAVVVLPGGGFEVLAIDLEGSEVCDWLTAKGITCVLLKYRVRASPTTRNASAIPTIS
jgi:acetyl esterase/lipase